MITAFRYYFIRVGHVTENDYLIIFDEPFRLFVPKRLVPVRMTRLPTLA